MNPLAVIILSLIVILIFFSARWILKSSFKNYKKSNLTLIIGSLLIITIFYLGLLYVVFSYLSFELQYNFDREKWFADKHARHEMRDDILKSGLLIGKCKSEIIELIGKSESNDSTNLWRYNSGTSGAGFGWQFNYLELTFQNNRVANVQKIEIID